MVEVRVGPLRDVVDVVRQIVTDWDAFVSSVEALSRDHERLRQRCETLERQYRELGEAHERLQAEQAATARALAELQAAHERLRGEHAEATRALAELRERYALLEQDRQFAADELEAILRRLKP